LTAESASQDRRNSPNQVVEIAANLDDVTPELIGHAQQQLLDAGALDVWTAPIAMKKQRPGVMLSLLCASEQREAMTSFLIELTGSFGVRYRTWDRLVLDRSFVTVETPLGSVRIKVGKLDGRIIVARPEFDHVRQLAQDAGVSVRDAMAAAEAAAEQWRQSRGAGS